MERLQMTVGFSLVVLATICKQTYAVLPHVNQYTPQVVQPLFDQMREYGLIEKNKTRQGEKRNQYLVVLIASHNEIVTTQNVDNWIAQFQTRFNGRVVLLLNQADAAIAEMLNLHKKHLVHGEVRFIFDKSISNNMLNAFREKHPKESPIILMYSHYIPCAQIPGVKYSCSEEVAVYATYNWLNSGLLVAFSTCFKNSPTASGTTRGTDEEAASQFLTLGGIPTFEYTCTGFRLKNEVNDAGNINRWHSVTFLERFFVCLDGRLKSSCLPDSAEDKKAIIAFFVNQVAHDCFSTMNVLWRKKEKASITECLTDRIEKRIGSDCKQCKGDCAALKKTLSRTCVDDSFDKSLVPGEPADPSDPSKSVWKVTKDEKLNKIFSGAPEARLLDARRNVFCKNPSLTLESLCMVSACSPSSSSQGSGPASSRQGSGTASSRQGSSHASSRQGSGPASSRQGSSSTSSPRRGLSNCCHCL